jgi:hypothetical protein
VYYDGTLIDQGTLLGIAGGTWTLKSSVGSHTFTFTLSNSRVDDFSITPVLNVVGLGLTADQDIFFYPLGIDNGEKKLVFPHLTEQTTGLTGVSLTNVPLQPGYDVATKAAIGNKGTTSLHVGGDALGTFSVSGGNLTLTLNSGLTGSAINSWIATDGELEKWFGDTAGDNAVNVSDNTVKVLRMGPLQYGGDEAAKIGRGVEVQEETVAKHANISYIWVDKDCTLSRGAKTININEYNNGSFDIALIDLPLKAGWNLVQVDTYQYSNDGGTTLTGNITVKIADKDIPWSVGFDH